MKVVTSYTIGIIGGGQLARMMHQAAIGLGVRTRLLASDPDESAAQVMSDVVVGSHLDHDAVMDFAAGCDVVTFDHEHVPTVLVEEMEQAGCAVRPGSAAMVHAQDKVVMREFMAKEGFPNPAWKVCDTPDDLVAFGADHGWPVIAKTSRGGYDGKGVFKIDGPDGAGEPFEAAGGLADGKQPIRILVEEFVDFRRELSAVVVRSPSG
ncbi:MAG: ATP-grasp domain-containing protein, partial [Cutibacterium avidum]|nr:ATP-grasp domain-containing protein [Cutibacterium avidum]